MVYRCSKCGRFARWVGSWAYRNKAGDIEWLGSPTTEWVCCKWCGYVVSR